MRLRRLFVILSLECGVMTTASQKGFGESDGEIRDFRVSPNAKRPGAAGRGGFYVCPLTRKGECCARALLLYIGTFTTRKNTAPQNLTF